MAIVQELPALDIILDKFSCSDLVENTAGTSTCRAVALRPKEAVSIPSPHLALVYPGSGPLVISNEVIRQCVGRTILDEIIRDIIIESCVQSVSVALQCRQRAFPNKVIIAVDHTGIETLYILKAESVMGGLVVVEIIFAYELARGRL